MKKHKMLLKNVLFLVNLAKITLTINFFVIVAKLVMFCATDMNDTLIFLCFYSTWSDQTWFSHDWH